MLKYIGYYAELPINLPKNMEERVIAGMREKSCDQGMQSVGKKQFVVGKGSFIERVSKRLVGKGSFMEEV